jgi:hypothetical protein
VRSVKEKYTLAAANQWCLGIIYSCNMTKQKWTKTSTYVKKILVSSLSLEKTTTNPSISFNPERDKYKGSNRKVPKSLCKIN